MTPTMELTPTGTTLDHDPAWDAPSPRHRPWQDPPDVTEETCALAAAISGGGLELIAEVES